MRGLVIIFTLALPLAVGAHAQPVLTQHPELAALASQVSPERLRATDRRRSNHS